MSRAENVVEVGRIIDGFMDHYRNVVTISDERRNVVRTSNERTIFRYALTRKTTVLYLPHREFIEENH